MSPTPLIIALGSSMTNGRRREVSGWIIEKLFLHAMEVLVLVAAESVKGSAKITALVCRGENVG